jgi:hypothetical protein
MRGFNWLEWLKRLSTSRAERRARAKLREAKEQARRHDEWMRLARDRALQQEILDADYRALAKKGRK